MSAQGYLRTNTKSKRGLYCELNVCVDSWCWSKRFISHIGWSESIHRVQYQCQQQTSIWRILEWPIFLGDKDLTVW